MFSVIPADHVLLAPESSPATTAIIPPPVAIVIAPVLNAVSL